MGAEEQKERGMKMKKLMKRIGGGQKNNSRKGFTLVELIVVLVILAILAAIMIPALTGWIDKAREKQVMLDARNVEMAAQAGLYQAYAADSKFAADTNVSLDSSTKTYELGAYVTSVCGEDWDDDRACAVTWDNKGNIITFKYTVKGGQTATFSGGAWKIGTEDESEDESKGDPGEITG